MPDPVGTDVTQAPPTTVTITIDGRAVEAKPGEMLIAAAERAGTYIPRFCYHPRMRPVGMCRMCLVEVTGPRGPALQPSCMVPVADGMVVSTEAPAVKRAQDGILELLLVNHPLDCPVCDRGGECPLQDQTLAFGPGETRFVEEKRHWEKPIQLSNLVTLDRERCIQCDRCTRFQREIAGDPLISFMSRGNTTEVNTFPDHPFASYFSGNTTQLCPVGALLPTPYRFKARPWDLEQVESTCTSCAVGCRIVEQSSTNRLVRRLGVDSEPVNHGWLCDKGRFDWESVDSGERLGTPVVRAGDDLVEADWGNALAQAADALRAGIDRGPQSVAVLGGARLTNEDAYAWSKFARTVLGTDNVDAQLGDGLPADVVLGLPTATIADACSAGTLLVLSGDLKEDLPVLFLRVRGAVIDHGVRLVELSPVETSLTSLATTSVRYRPGEAVAAVRELLAAGSLGDDVVCILGRPSTAESGASIAEAAGVLVDGVPGIRFLSGLRRGNVRGALDMGLAPGMLPGRVTLDAGRGWFGSRWGSVPAAAGMDATGILTAAAEGRIATLVLLGADPLADFPDRDLARRALAGATNVVAVDTFLTASSRQAAVVLPALMQGERRGTTTNIEGRITRLAPKVTGPGTARADWMIAAELAMRLGGDLGFDTYDALVDDLATNVPLYGAIAARMPMDGSVAGGATADGEAPPTMSHTDAAEVHAATDQGLPSSVEPTSRNPDAPAMAEGTGESVTPEPAQSEIVTVQAPVRVVFTGRSAGAVPAPAADAYSLRLVASRKLYGDSVLTQQSKSLGKLAPSAGVSVNPTDLDRLGVADGTAVRVSSRRGTLSLPVTADAGVPRGVALVRGPLPGADAFDLIDVTEPVTDVRVETGA
jgi:NADH-quinone oxidoreductase subunit G